MQICTEISLFYGLLGKKLISTFFNNLENSAPIRSYYYAADIQNPEPTIVPSEKEVFNTKQIGFP